MEIAKGKLQIAEVGSGVISALCNQPFAISGFFVSGRHRRGDAAARREVSDDDHPARREQRDQIVEDLVGDRLIEDAAIAEVVEVVLERLQLDTSRIGHVGDADFAEIGHSGLRADRGELRAADGDLVVAFRSRVGEGLEGRT